MKKVLCTFAIGDYNRCLDISRPTFQNYAYQYGYAYVEGEFTYKNIEYRPASWGKIILMNELLDAWDLVMWVDCDAMIIDPSVDLATLIPDDKIQAVTYHPFMEVNIPTAGVWTVRREMQPYLAKIWSMVKYTEHMWWEQAALQELMGYEQDEEYLTPRPIKVRDTELENSTYDTGIEWNAFTYKDFNTEAHIIHVPAGDVLHRTEWMQKWITKLQNPSKYQNPKSLTLHASNQMQMSLSFPPK